VTVTCARVAVGLALLIVPSSQSAADPIEDFYKGKTINMIVSAGEGGGFSLYAHAFARYLTKHIPGNPRLIVQNMPGAGGIRAMSYLVSVAPKDGTTIGLVHARLQFAPLFGLKDATFDPREMNWLGAMSRAASVCLSWHTSNVKTARDLFEKEFVVGGTGAGSGMEMVPALLNKLLDTKFKIISGYKAGHEVYLAMERGEVQGRCGGSLSQMKSIRPEWFPQNKVTVPVQLALERSPALPDVPAITEFVKDVRTKQILQIVLAANEMERPIVTPPGVPADRVAALRIAFGKAIKDPEFLADAEKQGLEIDEVSGAEVQELIRSTFDLPADVIKAAGEAAAGIGGSE
jgi:tripartite-type tricarboxylate transporter receptor subunit TctC